MHSDLFSPEEGFSFREFLWAYCVIESRGCYFENDRASEDIYALVPFGDFLNYSHVDCDCHFNPQLEQYEFKAGKRFEPGEEVFICYGRHHNFKLLKHYGFVLEENPYNRMYLTSEDLFSTFRSVESNEKNSKIRSV